MIKHDYAEKPYRRDPIARGDAIANILLCCVALYGFWFVVLWLAGGQ